MGTDDRIGATAQPAEGKVRTVVGELTDDETLEREDRADRAKGAVTGAVEDVKDTARRVAERIKAATDR